MTAHLDPEALRRRGIRMLTGLPPERETVWTHRTGPNWRLALVRRPVGRGGHGGGGLVLRVERWWGEDVGWLGARTAPYMSRAALRSLARAVLNGKISGLSTTREKHR